MGGACAWTERTLFWSMWFLWSTSVMVSHMPTLLQGHAMSTYMLISQSMGIPKDMGHTELSNFVGFAKVKGGSGIFQLVQK